ncbi:MAG TPA: hypothetical protein VMF29_03840 [Candidatus Edwardsbacteria bacterium]|nr:hypothetical protein [Candidatus Edwardsbacteria bacterium]
MKRTAITMMVAVALASLCLAQSDSAKPAADSARVKVQVEQRNDTTATVTVTSEPGKMDSTTTIVIHDGSQRRKRHWPPRARWVAGVRANAITQLPGMLFIYRRFRNDAMMGLGLECAKDPSDLYINVPHIGSVAGNWTQTSGSVWGTETYRGTIHSWYLKLMPELLVTRMTRGWSSFFGLQGEFCYARAKGDAIDSAYYSSSSRTYLHGWGCLYQYRANAICGLDRLIPIKRHRCSIGFIAAVCGTTYSLSDGQTTSTNEAGSYEVRQRSVHPLDFSLRNPFNGNVALQLKYWF